MDYLLDTNIISLEFRNDLIIKQKLNQLRSQNCKLFISAITYFEIKRGLFSLNATRKLQEMEQLLQKYQVILLDDLAIFEQAAKIHANLKTRGLPIQTEDILIASTAIIKDFILVSNDQDLLRVESLNLESW